MPIGKNIMNLFIKMEDDPKPDVKPEVKPVVTAPVANASAGRTDEKITQGLVKALEDANLDGYDYFEFAKTLDALRPSMPAEQNLYQTAFATGAVMGATKDNLLRTAQHYMGALESEHAKFQDLCKEQTENTVTGPEKQVAAVDEKIKVLAEQIKAITDEINTLSASKVKVSNDISDSKAKIEQIRNNFAATLAVFTGRIQGDLEKIQKYIA